MRAITIGCAILFVAGVSACRASSSPDGVGADVHDRSHVTHTERSPAQLEIFAFGVASAACGILQACCPTLIPARQPPPSCEAVVVDSIVGFGSSPDAHFDPTAAEACLSALAVAPKCETSDTPYAADTWVETCSRVLTAPGLVGGGHCEVDAECPHGMGCLYVPDGDTGARYCSANHVPAPPAPPGTTPVGDYCNDVDKCVDGAFCAAPDPPTCAIMPGKGAPCGTPDCGRGCDVEPAPSVCEHGLACVGGTCTVVPRMPSLAFASWAYPAHCW